MYKTETHLHVSEVSPCAKLSAEEMIKMYSEAGYTTVFVSDHFGEGFISRLGDIPWDDKITIFLSGYNSAYKAAEKYDINVLMSAEIHFNDSPNHYLVYGISKEFLCAYPELHKMTPDEFYKIAKQNNVFVVQAHPLRDGYCVATPECVDAFEIYNSNPRHENYSEEARKIALENNLYITSGSDAHRTEDVAKAGILSEYEMKTAKDYIELLKSGKASILGW